MSIQRNTRLHSITWTAGLTLGALLLGHAAPAQAQVPFVLRDASGNPLSGYQITQYASGLSLPVGMLSLDDGSLIYGANTDLYNNGTFTINRMVDSDNNGVADSAPGSVLYTAPANAGGVTSIARAGDLIVTLSSLQGNETARLSFLRLGGTVNAPTLSFLDAINLTFGEDVPTFQYHQSYGMAIRETATDNYEVYFNVGSLTNDAVASGTNLALANGMGFTNAPMNRDTIYRFAVDDSAGPGTPSVSSLTEVAYGVRNAAGMFFDPNGDLYFQDNGKDAGGNDPLSADELNIITKATLDTLTSSGDYGFESDYIVYGGVAAPLGYNPGDNWDETNRNAIQPVTAFLGQNGDEAQGVNHIALAPSSWSGPLSDGIFAGFHGFFVSGGVNNPENPVVFLELDALGTPSILDGYWQTIYGQTAGVGHLVGLHSTSNALYIADLSPTGDWTGGVGKTNGVIYRITEIPEPAALSLLALGVPLLLRRRR